MPARPKVDDPYDVALSAYFRARRGELQIKMADLADKSGIHPHQLSRLLNETASFDLGEMIALSRALGLEPAEVLANVQERVEKSQP